MKSITNILAVQAKNNGLNIKIKNNIAMKYIKKSHENDGSSIAAR